MPDRDRTTTAVDVLLEQALELQPAIAAALERAIEATREVTLLLQEEEALRDAEKALSGRKAHLTSASSLASSKWKRSERASRGLRELEQLGRAAADHSLNLKRVARRASPREAVTHLPTSLNGLARSVALPDGRVRVQDMADEMCRRSPERYSSPRSAYAAIYDQLRRSPDFERVGPGEFVLINDGRRSGAAGRYHVIDESADDLPFGVPELPARASTTRADNEGLPFK